MAKARTCVVCGTTLTPLDARTAPTCGAVACRWKHQSLPAGHACKACGRPLEVRERAAGLCDTTECRHAWPERQHFAGMRERRRRDRARLEERGQELRTLGAAAGVARPEDYPFAYIPRFDGRVTPLPRRRLHAHREHLRTVIERALEPLPPPAPDAPPPPDTTPEPMTPELTALMGQACGQCRGQCCTSGGDRAYLSADTMRRFMGDHPELTPDAVLDAYLARVPAHCYRHSCVYHRPGGCNLPREMRSDVCNRFYCGGLSEFRRSLPEGAPPRAFIVASLVPEAERGAFVTADGPVRVIRRRPLPVLGAEA